MKNPTIGVVARSPEEFIDAKISIDNVNKTLVSFGASPVFFVYPSESYYETNELTDKEREYVYKALLSCDGIIIKGGRGEFNNYDIEFIRRCIQEDIPILGICMGMQEMAIATSGKTRKFSDYSIHRNKKNYAHGISIEKNTYLENIFNTNELEVNSSHSCYVTDPGLYKVSAKAGNIIEAIEYPKNKFNIGVQWHPESMYINNKEMSLLFADFVIACENYKASKNKD